MIRDEQFNPEELEEKTVFINRVAKVVKGGRRFGFNALVVVGDRKGHVGIGMGKAREVPDAIQKAAQKARKSMIKIPIRNATIPHDVIAKFGASKVLLKPAPRGTGIIAGAVVRAVVELAGIENVVSKSLGSNNPHNLLKATMKALSMLRSPEEIAQRRGKDLAELGWR